MIRETVLCIRPVFVNDSRQLVRTSLFTPGSLMLCCVCIAIDVSTTGPGRYKICLDNTWNCSSYRYCYLLYQWVVRRLNWLEVLASSSRYTWLLDSSHRYRLCNNSHLMNKSRNCANYPGVMKTTSYIITSGDQLFLCSIVVRCNTAHDPFWYYVMLSGH